MTADVQCILPSPHIPRRNGQLSNSSKLFLGTARLDAYGETTKWMGLREVLNTPQSPWQNMNVDQVSGSIRRECLDHVIVFHETDLRRVLKECFQYYEHCRTHLSLNKDAPLSRPVQPPLLGEVIEIQPVGGLHHLYIRKAA